jgi:cytochrome c oxidase cbb3-type subunit I/II
MLNGLLTLRGAWDKLRTDPVLKFFVAGVTFYGMSTFEGPLLSIRAVNALSHYSDWTIGHVHAVRWAGTASWPRACSTGSRPDSGTKLYSTRWANFHFWIGTIGILVLRRCDVDLGHHAGPHAQRHHAGRLALVYPNFIDTLNTRSAPMMGFRIIGGSLYLAGMILMAVNIWRTIRGSPV